MSASNASVFKGNPSCTGVAMVRLTAARAIILCELIRKQVIFNAKMGDYKENYNS
jgi:hypothetical protein